MTPTAPALDPPVSPPRSERGRESAPRRVNPRRRVGPLLLTVLLALLALLTVTPFLVMLIMAFSGSATHTIPYQLPRTFTLRNFSQEMQAAGFLRWTLNSAIYAVVSVGIVLLTAAMAGYALAKKRFPGREIVFWSFLATLMVPFQAMLIPLFVLVSKLHGVNTYWGLIVPTLANAQAVFLLRQFIRELPDELFDAAKVDGCSEWRTFARVVLPLCKPVLATLGIFVFLWHWNDFLWPLVVGQSGAMQTLTVGLASTESQSVGVPQIMATATITAIPCLVIFVILQRYLVSSISMSGLKG